MGVGCRRRDANPRCTNVLSSPQGGVYWRLPLTRRSHSNKRPREERVRPAQAAPIDERVRVSLGERTFGAAVIHAFWDGRNRLDPTRGCEPGPQPLGREQPNGFGRCLHTARWPVKRSKTQQVAGPDADLVQARDAGACPVDRNGQWLLASVAALCNRRALDRSIAAFLDRHADEQPRFVRSCRTGPRVPRGGASRPSLFVRRCRCRRARPGGRRTHCLATSRSGARSSPAPQSSSMRRSAC